MRALAAALMMGTVLTAQTTTTTPKKITTAKKPAVAQRLHPTSPMRPMPTDPAATTEGLAAVGTMPAAPGTPAELFALRFIDLKIGDGEEAKPSMPPDKVVFYTVHYTGWTVDGRSLTRPWIAASRSCFQSD